jgi:hypothetical protein
VHDQHFTEDVCFGRWLEVLAVFLWPDECDFEECEPEECGLLCANVGVFEKDEQHGGGCAPIRQALVTVSWRQGSPGWLLLNHLCLTIFPPRLLVRV